MFERPEQKEQGSLWIRPDLLSERNEITRTATFIAGGDAMPAVRKRIYDALTQANLVSLSDEDWAILENTDSRDIQHGDFETVKKMAEANNRDYLKIKNALEQGTPLPAPTIVRYGEDKLHKIAGNTRLMVAKALGIRPQVLIGDIRD